MTIRAIAAVAAFLLCAAPALASQCPRDMAAVDAALAQNPPLSDAQKAEVRELRARGEEQHKAGSHAASVETLAKAKAILDSRR